MSIVSSVCIRKTPASYRIYYKDSLLVTINKKVFDRFLSDVSTKEYKKMATKIIAFFNYLADVVKYKAGNSIKKKTHTFITYYIKKKKEHYNGRNIKLPTEDSKDFKHFLKAAAMMIEQNVDCVVFLKSQIEGLQFVNDGKGRFPEPCNLSTSSAETRLLEYLKENDSNCEITMSRTDMRTPLTRNEKYVSLFKKTMEGEASLNEVLYVADCQKVRKGDVTGEIKKIIKMYQTT